MACSHMHTHAYHKDCPPSYSPPIIAHAHAHSACLHARTHTKTLPCMLKSCMHDHIYVITSAWHARTCILMHIIKIDPMHMHM